MESVLNRSSLENSSQTGTWDSNTTTPSSTQSQSDSAAATGASVALSVLYGVICVIGLVGNFLVLYAVCAFERMRTPTNIYLRNMSVSEALSLAWLPAIAYLQIAGGSWPFGAVACRLMYVSTAVTWSSSTYTLTAMSADRLMAVRSCTYKANRERCNTVSTTVCALIWIVSLLLAAPLFYFTHLEVDGDNPYCALKIPHEVSWLALDTDAIAAIYTGYSFILCFALPLSLTSIFYAKLLWRLRVIGRNRASRSLRRSNRKITRLVLAVVFCYVLCWTPYWTNQLLQHLVDFQEWGVAPYVQQLVAEGAQLLTYLNSMANPILYAFLSQNFRISFQKAFECVGSSEVNRLLAVTCEQSTMNPNVRGGSTDRSPRFHPCSRFRIYSERRVTARSLDSRAHSGLTVGFESVLCTPRSEQATPASHNSDGVEIFELGASRHPGNASLSPVVGVGHSKSCTDIGGLLPVRDASPL